MVASLERDSLRKIQIQNMQISVLFEAKTTKVITVPLLMSTYRVRDVIVLKQRLHVFNAFRGIQKGVRGVLAHVIKSLP